MHQTSASASPPALAGDLGVLRTQKLGDRSTRLTRDASVVDLVAFVHVWFDLVADGQLRHACDMLQPNTYGIRWSPDQLASHVREVFGPDTQFGRAHPEGPIFSRVAAAIGNPAVSVVEFADGSGFSVEHAVPLNGEYSDLTAQFEFRRVGPELSATLHDLHVL